MKPCESCSTAKDAADEAVKKVFAILGVNVNEPKEVEEFRENLRFGASMRKAADRGFIAIISLIATGMVITFWTGVISKIKGD